MRWRGHHGEKTGADVRGPVGGDALVVGLLSAASGAVDVLAFTHLGGAFASVITGNVVVVGIGLGSGHPATAAPAALAVASYAVGVIVAVGVTRSLPRTSAGARFGSRVLVIYYAQWLLLVVMAGLWIAWAPDLPAWPRCAALACASVSMGMQSRTVALRGLPGVSTTYFTGTLTGLLAGIVTDGTINRLALAGLLALLTGAVVSGWLVVSAPMLASLWPVALVTAVMVVITGTRVRQRSPRS